MATDVTRHIKREVERELWARAAGRCQFDGCNRLVFKSPVTQEQVNISEKAHIYSFSKDGPRGRGPFSVNSSQLNGVSNLMLVCHDCHKTIDQDELGERYSAKLLNEWKQKHERRIAVVTEIDPSKQSHVILYGANIGEQSSRLQPETAKEALFPDWYPAEEHPIQLSMSWEGKDDSKDYWQTESQNLMNAFDRRIRPVLDGEIDSHLSIFAFAPTPLLIRLGVLLTDKFPAQVYQLHREPFTWKWLTGPADFKYFVKPPSSFEHPPVLVFSLSAQIAPARIIDVLGDLVSIWELTVESPENDFLQSKEQLSKFRRITSKLLDEIGMKHGKTVPVAIFPAMPLACAVELGRVRPPKASNPWVLYDQNNKHGKFIRALEIGTNYD